MDFNNIHHITFPVPELHLQTLISASKLVFLASGVLFHFISKLLLYFFFFLETAFLTYLFDFVNPSCCMSSISTYLCAPTCRSIRIYQDNLELFPYFSTFPLHVLVCCLYFDTFAVPKLYSSVLCRQHSPCFSLPSLRHCVSIYTPIYY